MTNDLDISKKSNFVLTFDTSKNGENRPACTHSHSQCVCGLRGYMLYYFAIAHAHAHALT